MSSLQEFLMETVSKQRLASLLHASLSNARGRGVAFIQLSLAVNMV